MEQPRESDRGPGYVYLIRHQNSNGLHKIGRTTKPVSRMNQLGGEDLEIIAVVLCTDANEVELGLHRKYKAKRLPQSEWFNLSDAEVEEVQARLEQVFSDGRKYIKLRGKNLPSLSQIRSKDSKIQALEARIKTVSDNLEEGANKFEKLRERAIVLREDNEQKEATIKELSLKIDNLEEEANKCQQLRDVAFALRETAEDQENTIITQRQKIKKLLENPKNVEAANQSLKDDAALKEAKNKELRERLESISHQSEQRKRRIKVLTKELNILKGIDVPSNAKGVQIYEINNASRREDKPQDPWGPSYEYTHPGIKTSATNRSVKEISEPTVSKACANQVTAKDPWGANDESSNQNEDTATVSSSANETKKPRTSWRARFPWFVKGSDPPSTNEKENDPQSEQPGVTKRISPSEYCDENLFNRTHSPERDKAFLKAWNIGWFNKRYRPRLNDD